MEYITLKEICSIKTGKLDANSADDNGIYPFFTCAKEPSRINTFAYDCNCVLLAGNGEFNVNMYNGKFNAYQRTYIIEIVNKQKYNLKLVYYLVKNSIEHFKNISNGGVIKFIKLGDVQNIKFPQVDIIQQNQIVTVLDTINSIIDDDKKQLELLDELIKSRFIEMFGGKGYEELPFKDYAQIVDGDRGKNYPKSEEFFDKEYCLFLSAKNVTKEGFKFEDNQFITKEKDEILRNGKLKRGDIVITTRGTVGNIAYYNDSIPFDNVRINSGMVIIRKSDMPYNQLFFVNAFKNKIEEIMEKVTGAAQPQLPIGTMNNIKISYPPIELQNEFAQFVEQIDKSKFNKY